MTTKDLSGNQHSVTEFRVYRCLFIRSGKHTCASIAPGVNSYSFVMILFPAQSFCLYMETVGMIPSSMHKLADKRIKIIQII